MAILGAHISVRVRGEKFCSFVRMIAVSELLQPWSIFVTVDPVAMRERGNISPEVGIGCPKVDYSRIGSYQRKDLLTGSSRFWFWGIPCWTRAIEKWDWNHQGWGVRSSWKWHYMAFLAECKNMKISWILNCNKNILGLTLFKPWTAARLTIIQYWRRFLNRHWVFVKTL